VPFMTSTQISVLLNEVYIGAHTTIEIGAGIDLKLGAYLEIFGGTKTEIELAASFALDTVGKKSFTIGQKVDLMTDELKLSLSTLETRLSTSTISATSDTISGKAVITAVNLRLGI
jgi:hypothetical protein